MLKFRFRQVLSLILKCALAFVLLSLSLVVTLRFVPPPFSALMIERRIESLQSPGPYSPHYDWVSLDRIAPAMEVAVIASEDQNFLRHHGFLSRHLLKDV